ncbi:MAG: hypothetical protein WCB10_00880 [Steroidobacteraceae bacterium]
MRHVERLEDVPLHILREWLAGHALHDIAGERGTVVRISRHLTGREHARRHPTLQRRLQRHEMRRIGRVLVLERFFESGRVRHQIQQRDRLAERLRDLEIEIGVDVGVEAQLVLLDKLHQRCPGEELRDGSQTVHRRLGIDRLLRGDVGEAIPMLEDDLPVLHHDNDGARNIAALQRKRHESIHERVEILHRQRMTGRRRDVRRRSLPAEKLQCQQSRRQSKSPHIGPTSSRGISQRIAAGACPALPPRGWPHVWKLTRDAWLFFEPGFDAEQGLRKDVAVLVRRGR